MSELDIVRVINSYVPLKSSGNGTYFLGQCPFHVNDGVETLIVKGDGFRCLSCGAHGDAYDFIGRMNCCTPKAARDKLDGVAPSDADFGAYAIMEDISGFYQESLWGSPGERYLLKDRGLSREVIRKFGLGWSKPGADLLKHLCDSNRYTVDEIRNTEVFIATEKDIYDRFYNRVTFPIRDVTGRTIAFGGRTTEKDKLPKYINSTDTEIYRKGDNIYGLDLARRSDKDYFIIVEGYMDCIAMHAAGFDSTVAVLGTALTENQAFLLAQFKKRIVLFLDSDDAGRKAAARDEEVLRVAGLNTVVAARMYDPDKVSADFDPWDHDLDGEPDWLIKDADQALRMGDKGKAVIQTAIRKAQNGVLYHIRRGLKTDQASEKLDLILTQMNRKSYGRLKKL